MSDPTEKDASFRTAMTVSARQLSRDKLVVWLLLALNWFDYAAGIFYGFWASAIVLLLLIGYSLRLNGKHLLARHFSWASIFVLLLALFHLGYYLPVKSGLIDDLEFMPDMNGASSKIAMLLFCAAVLAFEAGALTGSEHARVRSRLRLESSTDHAEVSTQLLWVGLPILVVSVLLLAIFVVQEGGFLNTLRLSYTDYNFFLVDNDSRFVETGIQFFPAGILITYVGLLFRGAGHRPLWFVRALAYAFIAWLLIIGSRGTALLLFLGLLYVGHLCNKPVKWRAVLVIGLVIAVVIPAIAAYRNVGAGGRVEAVRDARFIPLAAALEMGQTYRTLVGFVDYFWADHHPLMWGKSYWMALDQLVPNVGLSKGKMPGGDYYRSTVWITELLDPYTASVGGGLGSTGIGEPYANFGYLGVVGLFWLFGFLIGGLEQYFLLTQSGVAIAAICSIFAPLNWYIRDDIYGTIRPIAWSLALLFLVFYWTRSRRGSIAVPSPSLQSQ